MALLKIAFGVVTAAIVSLFLYHASVDFIVQQQQENLAASLVLAGNRVSTASTRRSAT